MIDSAIDIVAPRYSPRAFIDFPSRACAIKIAGEEARLLIETGANGEIVASDRENRLCQNCGLSADRACAVTGKLPRGDRWERAWIPRNCRSGFAPSWSPGLFVLAAGAGLFGYRWYTRPVTLTIAVGSADGEAGKVMSAIAGRLVSMDAPVRLKAIETGSALEAAKAFLSGKADLAVVRGDTSAPCRIALDGERLTAVFVEVGPVSATFLWVLDSFQLTLWTDPGASSALGCSLTGEGAAWDTTIS
jgi:hypothetical protein